MNVHAGVEQFFHRLHRMHLFTILEKSISSPRTTRWLKISEFKPNANRSPSLLG
jgi:hypothetical protein